MRKICYVMTVVSKLTFFVVVGGREGGGRFPMRHWLKKDNQKT